MRKRFGSDTPHQRMVPHRMIMKNSTLFFICLLLVSIAAVPVTSAVTGADWFLGNASAGFTSRTGHTSVAFNDKLWVIGGTDGATIRNDTWSSEDGITWTLVNASPGFESRNYAASVVFNNRMWIIGGSGLSGSLNDTWSSADGNIWTLVNASAAFPARGFHSAAVYDNRLWVIGGYTSSLVNDTWSSTDGNIWTRVNASAAFPERESHSSVVFNNRLWVIGGFGADCFNDTWSSDDGNIWTLVNRSAAFPARTEQAATVLNGTLWLAGGKDVTSGTWMNDTWSSLDGNVWTLSNASAPFPARNGHTSMVLGNRMWIIGGSDENGGYYNDTWYTYGPPVPVPVPTLTAFPSGGDTGPGSVQSSIKTAAGSASPITFSFGQALSPTNPVRVESVTIVPLTTFTGEILCIVKDPFRQYPSSPAGQDVAGFAEIDLDWTRSDSIRQGTIAFSLDRQWMNDRHAAPADIVLLHNTGGTWQQLPTIFDNENGGRCYFTAMTPGFSVFAVAVKVPGNTPLAVNVSPVMTGTGIEVSSPSFTHLPTTSFPGQEYVAPSLIPTPEDSPGSSGSGTGSGFPLFPALAVAGVIILVILVFLVRRWLIHRQNPALFRKDR